MQQAPLTRPDSVIAAVYADGDTFLYLTYCLAMRRVLYCDGSFRRDGRNTAAAVAVVEGDQVLLQQVLPARSSAEVETQALECAVQLAKSFNEKVEVRSDFLNGAKGQARQWSTSPKQVTVTSCGRDNPAHQPAYDLARDYMLGIVELSLTEQYLLKALKSAYKNCDHQVVLKRRSSARYQRLRDAASLVYQARYKPWRLRGALRELKRVLDGV
jgi:hypothetical protein